VPGFTQTLREALLISRKCLFWCLAANLQDCGASALRVRITNSIRSLRSAAAMLHTFSAENVVWLTGYLQFLPGFYQKTISRADIIYFTHNSKIHPIFS